MINHSNIIKIVKPGIIFILFFLLLISHSSCTFIKSSGKREKTDKITLPKRKIVIEDSNENKTKAATKETKKKFPNITNITVSKKTNGILLTIKSSSKLKKEQISLFTSNEKNANITIYQTKFDEKIKEQINSNSETKNKIQLFNLEQSVQISISMTSKIRSHSIIVKNNKTTIAIFN